MNIRTSSNLASSLSTASFQIVQGRDHRGLRYRCRRDIMTMRLLHQDPFPAGLAMTLRGSVRAACTLHTGKTPKLQHEALK